MKYEVNVLDIKTQIDKTYYLEINSRDPSNAKTEPPTNLEAKADPAICFQIGLTEYEHCIRRSERLDNKIYILLTVCAFIFALLTTEITLINDIRSPQNSIEFALVGTYVVFIVLAIKFVISLLNGLIESLSSIKIKRFDSSEVITRKMVLVNSEKIVDYVLAKYEKARFENNEEIDKRYKKVDKCVKSLKKSVTVLIVLAVLGCFIPRATEKDRLVTDISYYLQKATYFFNQYIQNDVVENK